MPELPEVETVKRGLAPSMEGARLTHLELRRKDLRFPFPERLNERLAGSTIIALSRRAKYLLIGFDSGLTLISHLGMSGSYRIQSDAEDFAAGAFHMPRSKMLAHDHVTFHLVGENGEERRVIYNDPRRFGFLLLAEPEMVQEHPLLKSLGIEPLGNALSGGVLRSLFKGRRTNLKVALLDQKIVAGLGNIYVCEALWRSGLSPFAASGAVGPKKAMLLAQSIRDVLSEAIEAGGSSLRDHRQADGTLGYFQHRFSVYDREGEPCRRILCEAVIERQVQNGRSTFFCPTCQPIPSLRPSSKPAKTTP
jgi:formamidopyrimidine-DNA glycosylase